MQPINIKKEELIQFLRKIKTRKKAGTDGLKGEIYKWLGERHLCVKTLTSPINEVTRNMEPPQEWKKSKTVLIPKVAKPKFSEFRPIALTNTGYKLYMYIVKSKLTYHLHKNNMMNDFQ